MIAADTHSVSLNGAILYFKVSEISYNVSFHTCLDACDAKPCLTAQHLCYDIAGVCTCRKGLTLDEDDRCVGE